MQITAWSDSSGSLNWRIITPFMYLKKNGWDCVISQNAINDQEIEQSDIILLHNIVNMEGIASVLAYRKMQGKKLVVDVDDALFVTDDNPHKKQWDNLDAKFILERTVEKADLVTTTTPYLKEKLKHLNPNVVVLPNYYDPKWLDVGEIPHDDYTRIGWAGSMTHYEDLKMIAPIIDKVLVKSNVKFIICGDFRIKDMLEHKENVEIYPPVPIHVWPKRLKGMALDIGLAPLVDNEFNRCKSNIKALEYAMVHVPTICSGLPYENLPFVFNCTTEQDWYDTIVMMIKNKSIRHAAGKHAFEYTTSHFNIEDHWKDWDMVYRSMYG